MRFLPRARYRAVDPGYARITHGLAQRPIPSMMPGALNEFLVPSLEAGSPPLRVHSLLLLDIESLGFIGRPLFLIGVLHARTSGGKIPGLEVIQYLARDYSEEEAILRVFHAEAAEADVWVTYNGRTFDLPFLELRAVHHRLDAPRPSRHLDLLPVARRLWGETLPDCRLKTLERLICGRPRSQGDIDGARIPSAYHAFVRTGEPLEMIDILRHNAADLMGLLDLYLRVRNEYDRADHVDRADHADPARPQDAR